MKKRVFSGVQPTGNLHIGNYLGAIRQWAAMQHGYQSFFSVVDLHAITIPQKPSELKDSVRKTAGLLLAAGIDPKLSIIFIQSHVSAHAELAWILECVTPIGWLRRMTQFKEKEAEEKELASDGLFSYPTLMAADILLYDTDVVPVGDDQVQHLELTRDIAQRFNSLYGDTFQLPKAEVSTSGARIMGLDDPTKKMSKSETFPGHAIYLLDKPDDIRAKIARATTDSQREVRFDESRPGITNLLTIYEACTDLPRGEIEKRFEGKGYAQFKKELSEVVINALAPLQARYQEITDDPARLDAVLKDGEEQARPIAEKKLAEVRQKMGLS
jgi:tryptophanyl-tRNA synthetase